MKILIAGSFAPSLTNFRGSLIQAMRRNGNEVYCSASEDDPLVNSELKRWGAHFVPVSMARNQLNILADLQYWRAMFALCKKVSPDIVLAYTVKPIVYGLTAARGAGVIRRFALVTGLGYSFLGDSLVRRILQRIVVSLYTWSLHDVECVFFQNLDDRDYFIRKRIIRMEQAKVVNGSGVDLDYFLEVPLPNDSIIFLLIARLLTDKGIREYVEAARVIKKTVRQTRFLLVGPMDTNPAAIPLEEISAWQREEVIEYLGEVEDVRPMMQQASVYVLPSYREGTPRTVLEAMAMGRPIITTDAPGCRETVIDGDNGFLVPVKSVDALVAAMECFINNPALVERMGARSREIAVDKYDVRKVNAVMLKEMGI